MLKKIFLLVFTAFLIFSCASPVSENAQSLSVIDSQNNNSGSSMVKLIKADSFVHTKYGLSSYSKNFVILVKDAAYSKLVSVHHKGENNSWSDIPAVYSFDTNDGYEVWTLNFSPAQPELWEKQFCIRYQVNGQEYWDNNNGSDYFLGWNEGVILGNGTAVKQFGGFTSIYNGKTFTVTVDIKNLSYTKSVKIVYTTDNWATTKVAQASYESMYSYGYSGIHYSPNQYGVERWTASAITVPENSISVKYAISYDVNGTTYWDNNFGNNFSLTF